MSWSRPTMISLTRNRYVKMSNVYLIFRSIMIEKLITPHDLAAMVHIPLEVALDVFSGSFENIESDTFRKLCVVLIR